MRIEADYTDCLYINSASIPYFLFLIPKLIFTKNCYF